MGTTDPSAHPVITAILEACPSFGPKYEACEDRDLPYTVTGVLAHHLLELYQAGRTEEFADLAQAIEQLHLHPDPAIRELATIGILEDIQNAWGNRGMAGSTHDHRIKPSTSRPSA